MNKSQKVYIAFIFLVGLLITAVDVMPSVLIVREAGPSNALPQMVIMLVLMAVFRSIPLQLSEEHIVDVSFIIVLAAVLTLEASVVQLLYALSTPLMFAREGRTQKLGLSLLHRPVQLLFNTCIVLIALSFANVVFLLLGGNNESFRIPYSILPSTLFSAVVMVVNLLLLLVLFALGGEDIRCNLRENIVGILPNILATMPVGILLAYMLKLPGGEYLLAIFMLPLLLARYSFKLYVESKEQYINMIAALSSAIEVKDPYTEGHSRRVSEYAVRIAQVMNLPHKRIADLRVAALLHDIGKIGVNDQVLHKHGPLDDEEWKIVRQHPVIGYRIISSLNIAETAKQAILHHHERFDGKGYPDGKPLSELPLEVAILSIADAFDAMTSDRPYRKAMPKARALDVLRAEAGNQFHSEVVAAMEEVARTLDLP